MLHLVNSLQISNSNMSVNYAYLSSEMSTEAMLTMHLLARPDGALPLIFDNAEQQTVPNTNQVAQNPTALQQTAGASSYACTRF